MKKISIFFAVLFMFASYAEAQSSADSVSIRGRILLDFDDIDVPEPFSGAELFIMDKDSHRSLKRATTNSFGEFTFLMPKGEYYIGLYGVQYLYNTPISIPQSGCTDKCNFGRMDTRCQKIHSAPFLVWAKQRNAKDED